MTAGCSLIERSFLFPLETTCKNINKSVTLAFFIRKPKNWFPERGGLFIEQGLTQLIVQRYSTMHISLKFVIWFHIWLTISTRSAMLPIGFIDKPIARQSIWRYYMKWSETYLGNFVFKMSNFCPLISSEFIKCFIL